MSRIAHFKCRIDCPKSTFCISNSKKPTHLVLYLKTTIMRMDVGAFQVNMNNNKPFMFATRTSGNKLVVLHIKAIPAEYFDQCSAHQQCHLHPLINGYPTM